MTDRVTDPDVRERLLLAVEVLEGLDEHAGISLSAWSAGDCACFFGHIERDPRVGIISGPSWTAAYDFCGSEEVAEWLFEESEYSGLDRYRIDPDDPPPRAVMVAEFKRRVYLLLDRDHEWGEADVLDAYDRCLGRPS